MSMNGQIPWPVVPLGLNLRMLVVVSIGRSLSIPVSSSLQCLHVEHSVLLQPKPSISHSQRGIMLQGYGSCYILETFLVSHMLF